MLHPYKGVDVLVSQWMDSSVKAASSRRTPRLAVAEIFWVGVGIAEVVVD